MSDDDITRMRSILETLHDACERDSIGEVEEADMLFHSTIVSKYGDKHLLDLWQSVVTRMMLRYARFDNLIESYNEHRAILEAIEARDRNAAIKAVKANIQ
jgi:GntR family transcriptional repressor for pyruvate dehydrogenase complex